MTCQDKHVRSDNAEPEPPTGPGSALVDTWCALPVAARHRGRQHDRQRRPAHPGPPTARHHHPAAMGRRRLHPGPGRPAADPRQSGRPVGPPPHAGRGPGRLRDRVDPGRFVSQRRRAHRLPGPDGHRSGRSHAGHPVDPDQRVPRPLGASPGHRPVVRRRRPRHRHRPHGRRLAAGALQLGLHLRGQRAHRGRGPDRRPHRGAAQPGRPSRCPRPDRGRIVHCRAGRPDLRHHRGTQRRLAEWPNHRAGRWAASPCWPAGSAGSSAAPTRWSTCASFAIPASPPPASPSP